MITCNIRMLYTQSNSSMGNGRRHRKRQRHTNRDTERYVAMHKKMPKRKCNNGERSDAHTHTSQCRREAEVQMLKIIIIVEIAKEEEKI